MNELPIACSLDAVDARAQIDAWRALKPYERHREDIPGGVRVAYEPAAAAELDRVAAAERSCCGFLDIDVRTDSGALVLTVLAPNEVLAADVRLLGV